MENALCSIYLKAFSILSRVTTPAAVTSMYTCLFYFKNRLLSVLWDPMFCGIQISPQDDRQKDKKMFSSNKSISDFYHLLSSTVIKWRRKQSSPTFGFHWNASMWIFREHISPWEDLTLFGRAIPEGFLIVFTWVDASQEHLFYFKS